MYQWLQFSLRNQNNSRIFWAIIIQRLVRWPVHRDVQYVPCPAFRRADLSTGILFPPHSPDKSVVSIGPKFSTYSSAIGYHRHPRGSLKFNTLPATPSVSDTMVPLVVFHMYIMTGATLVDVVSSLPFAALYKSHDEIGYSYSCHVSALRSRAKKDSFLKRSMRGSGINQLILLLHSWSITSRRRLLLRWLPGVELLDDLRVDTI